MTKPPFNYPTGTTPEAIEAFRTMFGKTPEDNIRLKSSFESFLKGFISGRMSIYKNLSGTISDLGYRVDDLGRFKEATANYYSHDDHNRPEYH